MNVDKLLKGNGYAGHPKFVEIIKFAMRQLESHRENEGREMSEKELLGVIEWQFGGAVEKIKMYETPMSYNLWLSPDLPVDYKAIEQLVTALRLPVAIGGAGMPDLHVGYSLPIGGVVVLDNAVSPAFVGYDISCMMQLTTFHWRDDFTPARLDYEEETRKRALDWVLQSTSFGLGAENNGDVDHPVMTDPLWSEVPFLKNLKDLAWRQLGSSGAGNHFADVVIGHEDGETDYGDLVDLEWIGLLTHSGSRGVGNKVGHHYAVLADEKTRLHYSVPMGYGWFDIESDLGQEYLAVMGLMGRYAQANHDIIHDKFLKVSGLKQYERFSNKHNFAWVSNVDGTVIHRKGATPAYKGVMGIIPGSSGSLSFLVCGKGNEQSWNSASHGAGRPFSRTEAKRQYDGALFEDYMTDKGILYYGVAADETVFAYKDINKVIAAQQDLIDVVAYMTPKVVVMGGNIHSDDGD